MVKREADGINQEEEKKEYRMFDHVFFDVDSCLAGIEGIDELAQLHNCTEEIGQFTQAAMNGEVELEEVFEKRLDIINPRIEDLEIIGQKYIETVTHHAPEVIGFLQGIGMNVWLISGGYDEAIFPLADYLQIPRVRVMANHLYFNTDGTYLGFDKMNPLCRQFGKKECIARLKVAGVIQGTTAIVGDGISEVETKGIIDLCIGFGGHVARENVRTTADIFVRDKTLVPLVPILIQKV